MNSGIIAARYARALVKFIQDKEVGNQVYSQARILMSALQKTPRLRDFIENHAFVEGEKKISILETAVGEPFVPEFKTFITLVIRRKRIVFFTLILSSFIAQYQEAENIKAGVLIVPHPMDEKITDELKTILEKQTQAHVDLEMKVDPSILGGFIYEIDCSRLDASVRHKLDVIRQNLVENNNRIV